MLLRVSDHIGVPVASSQPPVTIVGAGGIGCAWLTHSCGQWPVTVVNRTRPRRTGAEPRASDTKTGRPNGSIVLRIGRRDHGLVILSIKCFDNAQVLERIPETVELIPVQNGFDPQLMERCRYEGIASFVSECHPDRTQARYTRGGDLHIGPCTKNASCPLSHDVASLAEALSAHGRFTTASVDHVLPYKYAKLMYNAAISPLAAVTGLDNGALLTHAPARRLFFALLKENYRILHAAGIELATIAVPPIHRQSDPQPAAAVRIAPSFLEASRAPIARWPGTSSRDVLKSSTSTVTCWTSQLYRAINQAACDGRTNDR